MFNLMVIFKSNGETLHSDLLQPIALYTCPGERSLSVRIKNGCITHADFHAFSNINKGKSELPATAVSTGKMRNVATTCPSMGAEPVCAGANVLLSM